MNCKVYRLFRNSFFCIFPIFQTFSKNKKLNKKEKEIYTGHCYYVPNYCELSLKELNSLQDKCFETKRIFEDKAKISTIGITICITLVIGLLTSILSFTYKTNIDSGHKIIILIMLIYALFNMVTAGILSLNLIGNLNKFYKLSPTNFRLNYNKKKKLISKNIELNVLYNIRRNNYLFAGFKSIINASIMLIFLFLFLLIIVPNNEQKNNKTYLDKINHSINDLSKTQSKIEKDIVILNRKIEKCLGKQSEKNNLNTDKKRSSRKKSIIKE